MTNQKQLIYCIAFFKVFHSAPFLMLADQFFICSNFWHPREWVLYMLGDAEFEPGTAACRADYQLPNLYFRIDV